MQHQNQGFGSGTAGGKADIIDSGVHITSAEIERHIARGKRMQAEAIAAFVRGGVRRLAALVHIGHRDKRATGLPPVQGETLSRA